VGLNALPDHRRSPNSVAIKTMIDIVRPIPVHAPPDQLPDVPWLSACAADWLRGRLLPLETRNSKPRLATSSETIRTNLAVGLYTLWECIDDRRFDLRGQCQ